MTTFSQPVYIVVANSHHGTPYEVLYGDAPVAYLDEEDAREQAAALTEDEVWGIDGCESAQDQGWAYGVEECHDWGDVRLRCAGHAAAVGALIGEEW